MNERLYFSPSDHLLSGPAGVLPVLPDDEFAHRFLLLVEGECLEDNIATAALR